MTRLSRRGMLSVGVVGSAAVATARFAAGDEKAAPTAALRAKVTPILTFTGDAEPAMKYYVAIFDGSKIESIDRYGPEGPGKEGSVRIAEFTLCGQRLLCIDSPVKHEWTFTPAISLYVEDPDEAAIEKYFAALSKQGKVFMPLNEYPFSKKFGWVQDQFGVSWQLSVS